MTVPSARVLRERAMYLYRFALIPRLLLLLGLNQAYRAGRRLGRYRYAKQRQALEAQAAEMRTRLRADPKQVDLWLERCFELAVCEDLDAQLFRKMQKRGVDPIIKIVGREHLDDALARGRGAILCSGHFFGHFTFFVALALLGYRPNLIGFPQTIGRERGDQWYPERRHALLQALGCRLLRMEPGNFRIAVDARNALARNEIVTVEIDHTLSKPTVETEFLGASAAFPAGPASLALTSGAPLLSFSVGRSERWHPQIAKIGAPFYVSDDIGAGIRHCVASLESSIIADPPAWAPWLFPTKFVWTR